VRGVQKKIKIRDRFHKNRPVDGSRSAAALMAAGCRQYRICNTGRCPVGVTSQDPQLRKRLKIEKSAKRLENFLRVSIEELKTFARLTGNDDIHKLSITDICTTNSEISNHTRIEHV